ncbi:Hsp20/alpha crystallin family protein [bacterium]|nr:Hsp20/alpha crystallin family protein [bacterium]
MPHIKFDPMKELEYLSQRMRKFADEFPETFSFEFGKGFEPKIDIYRKGDEIHVSAELPGMVKSDVQLSFTDGVLRIQGSKNAPVSEEEVKVVRGERSFGGFDREVALGSDIDPDSLSATMKDGVLSVVMRLKTAKGSAERTITID